MLGTFILTSPTILVPYLAKGAVASWLGQQGSILGGYNEQGFESVYQTGLPTWLYFFGLDYMKPFFFFFAFLALGVGSLLGNRKAFNRLNLGWCLATAFFPHQFLGDEKSAVPDALDDPTDLFGCPVSTDWERKYSLANLKIPSTPGIQNTSARGDRGFFRRAISDQPLHLVRADRSQVAWSPPVLK